MYKYGLLGYVNIDVERSYSCVFLYEKYEIDIHYRHSTSIIDYYITIRFEGFDKSNRTFESKSLNTLTRKVRLGLLTKL